MWRIVSKKMNGGRDICLEIELVTWAHRNWLSQCHQNWHVTREGKILKNSQLKCKKSIGTTCYASMILKVHIAHSIKCYLMYMSNVFHTKNLTSHITIKKTLLTLALKESIKTKNKLYVTSAKGSNKKEKSAQYRLYRNRLHHLLRSVERKYYHDLLVEHKSYLKQSWKIIKFVINKCKYHPLNSKFKYNGKVIDDGFEISNRFNRFFVHVGESLASVIPQSAKMPSDYLKHDIVNKMYLDPVTENEIDKIILNFRERLAGWDELKPTVIKFIRYCISLPLRHICKLSFRTGIFPDELKIANVVPIFKSGDVMIFSNYRPVSVLPICSKIIERLIYNRLLKYINDNNLFYKFQFGFQKGRSTHMALIILIDKISEALKNGDCVIGIFLDFSKALDTVDHYLSNRKQYVAYNGIKSQTEKSTVCPTGIYFMSITFLNIHQWFVNSIRGLHVYIVWRWH